MNRVLYISYDGMTDQLGQSQVIPYLKELSARGYKFTLLSVEKKEKLEKTGAHIKNLLEEAGIEWYTMPFTSNPPVISKWLDQRKLNRLARKLHREKKFDFVHCRSYVPAEAGYRLSKQTGIPFLFDMRGFWVDERVDAGLWNLKNPFFNFLYKIFKKKEKGYFSSASHIISLTQKGKAELGNTFKIATEKITVIPCCADFRHFDYHAVDAAEKKALKERLQIPPGSKVLSYLGSLGGWYMTIEMLDFFAVLVKKIPSAIFLFITNDKPEAIIKLATSRGIPPEALRIAPASRKEVPLFLSLSDWNVFFIKDVYSKKASSPTKQGEVMAMGIPVVCNDIGDTGEIIRNSGSGIVINSFDANEYGRVCEKLDSLSQLDKMKIRQSAKDIYDLQTGVDAYEKVYRRIIDLKN